MPRVDCRPRAGVDAADAAQEVLHLFAELAGLVARLTNDIGSQERAVRISKGVSAAISITGTVMAFMPPLLPSATAARSGGCAGGCR